MGSIQSRTVQIQISNKTRNITLRNPRTYFDCGYCTSPPVLELSPGSSDTSRFRDGSSSNGVAGILVYEADSFTLAIHFCNPCYALGLELSPSKAHLGRLGDTYARMAAGTYSSSCPDIKFDRVVVVQSHGSARLSHGRVKVTATMSRVSDSQLKVVLEEQAASWEKAVIRPLDLVYLVLFVWFFWGFFSSHKFSPTALLGN